MQGPISIFPPVMLLGMFVVALPPLTDFKDPFNRPLPPVEEPAQRAARSTAKPRPRCPEGMVEIPGGTFDSKPLRSFCLDVHEVTVDSFAAYLAKLEAAPSTERPTKTELARLKHSLSTVSDPNTPHYAHNCTWRDRDNLQQHPLNCISQVEAEAYCRARGQRLPTGLEWKWAARSGTKEHKYPWGDAAPSPKRLHMAAGPDDISKRTLPVKLYRATGPGLYDMAGNVWEWTACPREVLTCSTRGGGFRTHEERHFRAAFERTGHAPTDRSDEIGFRCAAPLDQRSGR